MARNKRLMAKLPGGQFPEHARWSPKPSGPGPSFRRKGYRERNRVRVKP